MMSSTIWTHLVLSPATLHSVSSVAPCCESLGIVAMSSKWSIVLTLHCSRTVTICLHTLLALTALSAPMSYRSMMGLMLDAFKMCARALETCVPSYTGRTAKLFFMLEARGPQGAAGYVAASELISTGRRGPKP
jgi:hypothetical protein